MLVNAMMTYTLSPVHTDDYYVERARELVALQSDFISVKDPTGLLTPERAKTLFPALLAAADGIPLQLHMHCQSGLATQVHEVAIQSGFRYGHTASEPLANGASHPATEEIDDRARALGFATGIDRGALADVSAYFGILAEREGRPRGKVQAYDAALYEHQVPGGMISNLRSQLATMRMEHRLPEILEEAARVRKDLGYRFTTTPLMELMLFLESRTDVRQARVKFCDTEISLTA